MARKPVLVTGGNSGIGLALCKQLASEHNCHVYLGARNLEKGQAAVLSIIDSLPECRGAVELVQIDAISDSSVASALETVKAKLGSAALYAVVNNAGTGLAHGGTAESIIDTNLYGPKRVCEAFIPLLSTTEGRIVNVGSGMGPRFVSKCDDDTKRVVTSFDVTWQEIERVVKKNLDQKADAYGLSKCCLTAYTMLLARENPNLKVSAITPGFVNTDIVAYPGMSILKCLGIVKMLTPEEGTKSIRHCLFADLEGNGYYYGSDAVRSPLDHMRNPGEPPYTGS